MDLKFEVKPLFFKDVGCQPYVHLYKNQLVKIKVCVLTIKLIN